MRGRIHKVALVGWRGMPYLDLELDEGPLTALVGEPGAGKSTIAMLICYALLPDRRTLKIHFLSEVQDKQQAGNDAVSSKIDPLVGFAYVLLEILMEDGHRVIAGIHVREADGEGEFTRIHLQNVPSDWPLQDCLRIVDGDEESYPDLNDLAASLAARGVMLRQCKTVREYGEVLHAAGVLPCDYSDSTERRLFARLIESTFRGGLSPEVAGQIKEYMLPPATRLPDSVDRLQRCAETVTRTHSALEEAERQLKLLEVTYGLGKRIVTTALAKATQEMQEAERRHAGALAEAEVQDRSAKTLRESMAQVAQVIQSAQDTKIAIEDQFTADLSQCAVDQQHWTREALVQAGRVEAAKEQITRFHQGREQWFRCLGRGATGRSYEQLHADLERELKVRARQKFGLERQLEEASLRRDQLMSGLVDTASVALARALEATSIAETLEDAKESEARVLEMALGGLVEGVVGADVAALAALEDDPAYPDTFWLRSTLPEHIAVQELGPWYATSMPGGFVVTSRRRRLTLGRQARELEVSSLDKEAQALRTQLDGVVGEIDDLEQRRNHLLKGAAAIQAYLTDTECEPALLRALEEAKGAHVHAQQTRDAALKRVSELNIARERKTQAIDRQLIELRKQHAELEGRSRSAQNALERARADMAEAKDSIASGADLQRKMKEMLAESWDWLSVEASEQATLSESDFVSRQTHDLTRLGLALADEAAERMVWLQAAKSQDPLTLCAIWTPLREIVSDRINVDCLESDGINLIADMAERRRTLGSKLDADRAEMRAQAHSLYTTIGTEIRKQERRVRQLSAFGDALTFGNISGMQIVTHRRQDLLERLQAVAKQIDLFVRQSDVPLDVQLNELFGKALGIKFDGQALLDYRTYMDVAIEVKRNGKWESATGLSGGESIGGGLALSLMLAKSLALRGDGQARHFTPIFVVDEVQRLNAAGQALIVEFGRRQGFQVVVTGLSLEASFPCTMHVMSRHFRPQETVVARRVKVVMPDVA